jgi:hypothetical protein
MAKRPEHRRRSVQQAASVPERESWDRHECDEIARRRGIVILFEPEATYLDTGDGPRLLCRPMRPDRLWYETWLELRRAGGA